MRKRGYFRVKGYGLFKRNRSNYRSVIRRRNRYYDVMGTAWKTKKGASSGNAFINGMGL